MANAKDTKNVAVRYGEGIKPKRGGSYYDSEPVKFTRDNRLTPERNYRDYRPRSSPSLAGQVDKISGLGGSRAVSSNKKVERY